MQLNFFIRHDPKISKFSINHFMFVAADKKQYLNSNDKSAQNYATEFQSSTESMIDGQILNAVTSFSKTSVPLQ